MTRDDVWLAVACVLGTLFILTVISGMERLL